MDQFKISYLKYEDIDTDMWDRCMENAPNSLIYSQSWYLDRACERWDALVMGNYQYVMPLTYRKKFGITYLFQPLFCQQLGIFPTPDREISKQFLREMTERFLFAEINLNAMQQPVNDSGLYKERVNLLLSLQDCYETIVSHYSKHTRRKLKQNRYKKLSLVKSISAEEYLKFKKKNLKKQVTGNEMNKLKNILVFSLIRNSGQIYGVYSPANELCAAAFFVRHKHRVTYLNAVTNQEGKEHQAMYFLIDQFIREHAGKDFLMDFEGSMVPGVARLYEGFGATSEKYYRYRWNNLPWWIKWVKK